MIYRVLITLWEHKGGRQTSLQSKINKIKIAPHGGRSHAVAKFVLDNVFWLRGWREMLKYTKGELWTYTRQKNWVKKSKRLGFVHYHGICFCSN